MFGNLTIKTRLVLLISFMAALLLVIGGIGLSGMGKTDAGLKTVYEDRTVPLMDLGRIIDMANRTRTNATVAATAPWAEASELTIISAANTAAARPIDSKRIKLS